MAASVLIMVFFSYWPKDPQQLGGSVGPSRQTKNEPQQALSAPPGVLQKNVDPTSATQRFTVNSISDLPEFDVKELTVKPNEVIALTFKNDSPSYLKREHNWVLITPGREKELGVAAEQAGPQRAYIPESEDVLAHSRVVMSGQTDTIYFRSPSEPGDYPYLCTYPGHHHRENGVLHVESSETG
jgi:azurin